MLNPVVPFEPISTDSFPKGGEWIAQIKWDGVRMLSYCDGSKVQLVNRRLNNRSLQYPEFLSPSRYCSASSFILDGEFIAFDHHKPSFHEIMKRDSLRKQQNIELGVTQTPVTYMIFDVLFCSGQWVTDKPLAERQRILQEIVIPQPDVQTVQNFTDPDELLQVMIKHQMEGVVCKDLNSTYMIGGKDKRWQKRKIFYDLLAVVGGVTYRDNIVNSLLLGLYDGQGNLYYIGHAGTGKVTQQEWRDLTARVASMRTKAKPFVNEPERSKDAVWIDPQIVVKVQFMEWTPGHTMRHPSIQAFVETNPSECKFPTS
ncbi:DNA ligase [Paenibacillus elgii]|uniref:DNA ligase (ATP) n=1 Tax=Paenibacillus elgii TaxID=189691 RepID=A0A2T6G0U7_9BACL|nr:RNA ligase family protein [Paenibacillus elgii]PUA37790.1 DNA ligase [Paenibacillus elgii]